MQATQIRNLVYRYAREIDRGDFAAVANLFRHAEIVTAQATVSGYDEVLAMYRASTRLYEDGTPRTRHITTNLAIELQGEKATCHSYFTVMQALEDFPLQAIICGHYEDDFCQGDGGEWRFQRRKMFPELLGDLSRHLLFDVDTLKT